MIHPVLNKIIQEKISNHYLYTPLLVFSKDQLIKNIHFFCKHFSLNPSDLFFPVKTNNHPDVLKILDEQGVSFEIASEGELLILKKLNIRAEKIIFGNPIKIESHILHAAQYGIHTFVADHVKELIKIKNIVPNANIILRIAVSNKNSSWSLSGKFGAEIEEISILIDKILTLQLNLIGISFHVGWNNQDPIAWGNAIRKAEQAIKKCTYANITLNSLNIGGGFPAHQIEQYDALKKIADFIKPSLNHIKNKFQLKIIAEPGSFLTANAGAVMTQIVEIIQRKNTNYIFIDTGIAQGFYWSLAGIKYQIIYPYPLKKHKQHLEKFTVTGPTCDSQDVFGKQIELPPNIKKNDILLIYPAGAYITSAKQYNGFDYPELVVV